jgi:hypothetical protein
MDIIGHLHEQLVINVKINEKITAAFEEYIYLSKFSTFRLSMQPFSRDTTSTSDEKTRAHTTATKRDISSRTERNVNGKRERETERSTTCTHT